MKLTLSIKIMDIYKHNCNLHWITDEWKKNVLNLISGLEKEYFKSDKRKIMR